MKLDVLSTPGHLISLAARGFARLSEALRLGRPVTRALAAELLRGA